MHEQLWEALLNADHALLQGNYASASQHYLEAINYFDKNPSLLATSDDFDFLASIHYSCALCQFQQGNYPLALKSYLLAVDFQPALRDAEFDKALLEKTLLKTGEKLSDSISTVAPIPEPNKLIPPKKDLSEVIDKSLLFAILEKRKMEPSESDHRAIPRAHGMV